MSPKHFFIAHGEKVALSATVLFCALQLGITFSDSSVRPTKVTPADIDAKNTAIENVFAQGKPPVLKPVPPYLGDMQARLAKAAPTIEAMAWLSAPPDRGTGSGGLLLYVYELPAPTINAEDTVGRVALQISLPLTARAAGQRISDGPSATWERAEGVTNHARQLGVLIETHRGDNQWKPLTSKAVDKGFISLEALEAAQGTLLIEGLEPWVRHSFRARLVAAATALDLAHPETAAKDGHTVLVVAGRLVPVTDTLVPWNDLTAKFKAQDKAVLAQLARPEATPIPGVQLADGEQAFLGERSVMDPHATVQVTSDIRFALDKIGTDLADPTKEIATFLVTKQFTLKDGAKAWLEEAQSFKAAVGDTIGSTVVIPTPPDKQKKSVKLETGFKVLEIKRNQKRILYWEVLPKQRAGGKGKDLVVEPKEVQTDLVVVENIKTHTHLTLMKLQPVKLPPRVNAILFPFFPGNRDEEAEFRKDPSTYVQADLTPVEPKQHPADAGPLAKLRDDHPDSADLYNTDTPYYELGDGRLVWWEPLNKVVRQDPEPEAKAAEKPAAVPLAPPIGAPPSTTPPGMPPGMTPPGMPPGMPPGFKPPGQPPGIKPPTAPKRY